MAHLSEGTLRRLVDDHDVLAGPDARHYATCADCRARQAAISDDAHSIANLLVAPALKVDVGSALQRVQSTPAAQPRFGLRLPILMRPASRPLLGALAAAAVLFALVASGTAQGLIVAFQGKTVTPVPVTVADLEALSKLSAYGTVTWTKRPQPNLVTSAAEAASVSGLKVPAVGTLPDGVSRTVTYAAMPEAIGVFTFDASKAAAAAASTGKSLPALPKGINGSTLTVTVGPAVVEIFGNLKAGATSDPSQINLPQLIVAESTAPVVTSSGVTTKQLEDYLLSLPGISPALAAAIRAIKDPSTTLPIPIPIAFATSTTVKVQGAMGVALGDNTGLGSAVIWIKNGVVYGVAGTLKQKDVLDIANHLH